MVGLELPAAVVALLVAVVLGTVIHELVHAAVLAVVGVPFRFQWLHGAGSDALGGTLLGTWASVEPTSIPRDLPPWTLRVASLAPLALGVPLLVLVPTGVLADPFAADDAVRQAVVLGWLACSLPSPADFSLAFHATDVVAGEVDAAREPDLGDAAA